MFILLALDPSTTKTGWAIFSKEPSSGIDDVANERDIYSNPPSLRHEETVPVHPKWQLTGTGVIIGHRRPWRAELSARIKGIGAELDRLAEAWHPYEVACGKPSIMHLPNEREGVEMLSQAMEQWAQQHNLPLYCYPLREIRAVVLGRSNAASEELAYATMTRWGLLGEEKSTHEWNAIAVGDYHLGRQKIGRGIEI